MTVTCTHLPVGNGSLVSIEAAQPGQVVADVGELADLVTTGVSGYLIAPDDLDGYADRVI